MPVNPRRTDVICTLRPRQMFRDTTMFSLSSGLLRKVKPATLMAILSILKKRVIRLRAYPSDQPQITWQLRLLVRLTSTQICIPVWPRLPAMKVLTKLLTGWKLWLKQNVHMPIVSRKPWGTSESECRITFPAMHPFTQISVRVQIRGSLDQSP